MLLAGHCGPFSPLLTETYTPAAPSHESQNRVGAAGSSRKILDEYSAPYSECNSLCREEQKAKNHFR